MTDRFRWCVMVVTAAAALGACRSGSTSGEGASAGYPDPPVAIESARDGDGAWTVLRTPRSGAEVRYRSDPSPIPLNEPFSLEVDLRSADGAAPLEVETLEVDGRMPHHRHGMNTVPRITSMGGGRYRVDGMLFHMPGRWELSFDLTRDGVTERVLQVVMLD